jgi:hypothetical protein
LRCRASGTKPTPHHRSGEHFPKIAVADTVAPVKGCHQLGLLALIAACALSACGSASKPPPVHGAGQGIGAGLKASGLQQCTKPISSDATGAAGPAMLSVYAEHGFAAIVASGAGAEQDAIDLAMLRNHIKSSTAKAQAAASDTAWRTAALADLAAQGVPAGPCTKGTQGLPILAPTEVVCSDQLLIPLGRRRAMPRFVSLLSRLTGVKYTPAQYHYLYNGIGSGGFVTTPSSLTEQRPYCPGN